jgi:hypothetical protein
MYYKFLPDNFHLQYPSFHDINRHLKIDVYDKRQTAIAKFLILPLYYNSFYTSF